MLEQLIEESREKNWQIYGISIRKNGRLLERHDFVPDGRHPIYSATKSFTATAVGLAVDEGKLSLEESLITWFQEESLGLSREQNDFLKKASLRHLLTMGIPGYPFRPQGEDWLSFALQVPVTVPESPVFSYSNLPAYLAGVIVERATGKDTGAYLEEKLFRKIGIREPVIARCPAGHFYGASGMELSLDELSLLGELYLAGGLWEGEQILSRAWTEAATSLQNQNREGGYGYFFWKLPGGGSRISGKWGQRCYILPEQQAVVTVLAHLPEQSEQMEACIRETILAKL